MESGGPDELAPIQEMLTLLQQQVSGDDPLVPQVVRVLAGRLQRALAELQDQNRELEAVRVELQYQRRRYVALFDKAPDAYVVTDTSGVIRQANRAASRLLGTPAPQLSGRSLAEFVRRDDRATFESIVAGLEDQPASAELLVTPRNLPSLVVAATIVPRPHAEDRRAELWWMLRDVTDARRAQVALQEAFVRSREEVDELRDLDRWKTAFLSAAAHDIHAPLRSIEATVRALVATRDLGDARDPVQSIGDEAERLGRLLDDLLDLDRFTRGEVTARREPTDLAVLVRQAVGDAGLGEDEVRIEVTPDVVDVDPGRTGQIVTNLVRNAWTHTPRGTRIHVIARADEDRVELVVEDDGPGIPVHLHDEVFRPFVTRHAHEADRLGTGLGLSLVRLFAELHQGTASIEPTDAQGTRVVVHLPARVHEQGAAGPERDDS